MVTPLTPITSPQSLSSPSNRGRSFSNEKHEGENHFDFWIETSEPQTIPEQAIKVVKHLVSGWDVVKDEDFKVKEVQGGVTNKLYCVSHAQDKRVLVRIYGNQTEVLINRDSELKNIVIIHRNGFAPKFYGYFENGFVYGFFEGRDLSPEDLRGGKFTEQIATKIAGWHKQNIPNLDRTPHFLSKLDSWMSLVPDHFEQEEMDRKFKEKLNLPELKKEALYLKEKLIKYNSPIVFAHNDLQGKNIIYNAETSKKSFFGYLNLYYLISDLVHFIDYEYGAYNFRAFDIANHFCEFAGFELDYSHYPSKERQYQYFKCYLRETNGREANEKELEEMYREINAFALASHFLWATWGLVQAKISDIKFDFLQYSIDRYAEYYRIRDKTLESK